jgi:hypothetical protein
MWSNLLSGVIGSVLGSALGVVGAYYLAVRTLMKTRENERVLTREQASVDSAGEITVALIEFYDGLDELWRTATRLTMKDNVEIDSKVASFLWPAMADLSRRVTVHQTMLPSELAAKVSEVRVAIREIFGVMPRPSVTKEQLMDVRIRIRSASDELSKFRRQAYLDQAFR